MIRHSLLSLATLALLAGWSVPAAYAITFPDKNLEAALRTMVYEKRTNMEELTAEDLRKISTLEARGRKIQNLTTLEKCTNILLVDLSEHVIVDLGPLRGLVGL